MKTKAGFTKRERIVSKRLMEQLFENGRSHSLTVFPLRAVYQVLGDGCWVMGDSQTTNTQHPTPNTQILVSVSKRHFKHAVDRNRVKRQIREAYRLNKQLLSDSLPQDRQLAIAFIWMTDELLPSTRVTKSVTTILRKIGERLVHVNVDVNVNTQHPSTNTHQPTPNTYHPTPID